MPFRLRLPPRSSAWVFGVALIFALALAFAWPMQGAGNAQDSQYALVKALAEGSPRIDRTRHETGDIVSNEYIRFRGHEYSNKAPGLALVSLPAYFVARSVGMRTTGDPSRILWALGLLGVVVPAVALALLAQAVAERIEPGFGTAATVVLGLGTLILPFASIFYNHVFAACLAFAAFTVLWFERQAPGRFAAVFAAGILAGLAVTVEYANAIVASVLLLYAGARVPRVPRVLAYGGGGLVGLLPLLAYNQWAFGSVTRVSYLVGYAERGPSSDAYLARHAHPSALVVLTNLASNTGLLTLAPVLFCGCAGTVLLYRSRWRVEALVISAAVALVVLYASSFGSAFGGFSAGPRYVIPALPFFVVPLAAAFRAYPVTTAALGLISIVTMTAITATYVLAGHDGRWFHRLADRQVVLTAASFVGITGWYAIVVFFAACAIAVGLASRALTSLRLRRAEALCAAIAVGGWILLKATAPTGEAATGYGRFAFPSLAVLLIGGALGLAGVLARHAGRSRSASGAELAQLTSSTSSSSSTKSPSSR